MLQTDPVATRFSDFSDSEKIGKKVCRALGAGEWRGISREKFSDTSLQTLSPTEHFPCVIVEPRAIRSTTKQPEGVGETGERP
jgi:hypothetical protein